MSTEPASRFHILDGVHNFRDFGGYAAGERFIPRGKLFRSGSHAQASDADLARLSQLGISLVVDLRRPDERERNASRRWAGFDGDVIQNDNLAEGPISWDAFMSSWDMTGESFHAFHESYYAHAPFAPRLIDLMSRAFDAFAIGDGGVLVHCAAGKDRTGLLVALTHHMLGVHPDDILEDYLLTNQSGRFERAVGAYLDVIEKRFGKRPPLESMRVAMSVHEDYLARSLSEIRKAHGDTDRYLSDVLGVTSKMRERIERRFLA